MKTRLTAALGIFAAVMLVMLAILALPASAEEQSDGMFIYTCENNEVTIVGYQSENIGEKLVIPEKLGGHTVTAIGEKAFMYCKEITSVVMPDTVKTIGERAFSNCNDLTSVTIPKSVTRIGNYAFSYSKLTSLTIPGNVKTVGEYAFYRTPITTLTVENGVTEIGECAFYECMALKTVTLPDSIKAIGYGAFYYEEGWHGDGYYDEGHNGNGFIDNFYGPSADVWFSLDLGSATATPAFRAANVYLGGKKITDTVTLPSGVKKLMPYCIPALKNVKNVILPSGLKEIGDNAFAGCSGITTVSIPDSVTKIGKRAFSQCVNLTSISIPDGVTEIGDSAFDECYMLASIHLPRSLTRISPYLFRYCQKLTSVDIPGGVTSIGERAFQYCSALSSVTIPNSVKTIEGGAFQSCTKLGSISLPDSVKTMYGSTFYYCEQLRSVKLPAGLTRIDDYTFYQCTALDSITIPESVTQIALCAFDHCTALKTINLPKGLIEIGKSAFYYCISLKNINIPDSVTTIGTRAFECCYALDSIIYREVENMGTEIFRSCKGLTSVIIPEGTKRIPDGTFMNCTSLVYLTIPKSIKELGKNAFENCTSLEHLTVPKQVAGFDGWFKGCTALKCIYYNGMWWNTYPDPDHLPKTATVYYNTDHTPYCDVHRGQWFADAAVYCHTNCYMSGTKTDTFSPAMELTRAQFVQILAKIAGADLDSVEYKPIFTDVPNGKWYSKAVTWASEAGVTGGMGNGLFAPDAVMSREQLATFLCTYARKCGIDTSNTAELSGYNDEQSISAWAKSSLGWAVDAGLISGISANRLAPRSSATRAQASLIVKNLCIKVLDLDNDPENPKCLSSGAFKASDGTELKYLLYTPKNSDENTPLLVYFHEKYLMGDDLRQITCDSLPRYLRDGELGNFNAYVLMPQLPAEKESDYSDYYKSWKDHTDSLMEMINSVRGELKLEDGKLYLSGNIDGGRQTCEMVQAYPGTFDGIIPMNCDCAGYNWSAEFFKNTPVWLFVSENDEDDVLYGDRFIDSITALGGIAKMTICNGDIPATVYKQHDILAWLAEE